MNAKGITEFSRKTATPVVVGKAWDGADVYLHRYSRHCALMKLEHDDAPLLLIYHVIVMQPKRVYILLHTRQ